MSGDRPKAYQGRPDPSTTPIKEESVEESVDGGVRASLRELGPSLKDEGQSI